MNPEIRFRELLSKLLDGEFSADEREELARLCEENESFRETLRAELELDELIRHAASEFEESSHHFSRSLESRILGEAPEFDRLREQLIAGDLAEEDIEELVRHCRRDEENAIRLCRDLKWADLLEQASAERRSEETFLDLLRARISRELADFGSLAGQLIDGEETEESIDDLVRHCRGDENNAVRLRADLNWSDLLEQAATDRRSEETFINSLETRLSGEAADFNSLTGKLIEGDAADEEIAELVRHCRRDEENAINLGRDLKWADLLEQASTGRRSEEAFIESLATRMWAEQEQDHFVEATQSKIVRLFPESAQPTEPVKGTLTVLTIGTWATAAAAAIAVAAVFMMSRSDSSVARIVHATKDVRWEETPGNPDRLKKGHYRLASGVVTLEFANHAEMTIEGPAVFDLRGNNQAFVHSGIAMLDQDESNTPGPSGKSASKAGFTLQSRGLDLIDTNDTIGIIGINASNASATEAVVFNGGAEVCLPSVGGGCRNLYQYEAVRIDLKRDKLFDVPYNPKAFARSWEVLAGVEDNTGSVRIELPGEKPVRSKSESREVQLFVESDRFVADRAIEVDTLDPGQFATASASKGRVLPQDRELRSYLLQLWPEGSEEDHTELEASVTFSHEVVGVIYSSERLKQSDSIVGSEVASLEGGLSLSRGLDDSDSEGDSILLSDDLKTLNLRLKSGTDTDQLDHVRVLVALN